jgi:hypothetical protein
MVKLYIAKDKKKYIDISIWSLLKANILVSLLIWLILIIIYGIFFALMIILYLF